MYDEDLTCRPRISAFWKGDTILSAFPGTERRAYLQRTRGGRRRSNIYVLYALYRAIDLSFDISIKVLQPELRSLPSHAERRYPYLSSSITLGH